jgi:hypothetical protein
VIDIKVLHNNIIPLFFITVLVIIKGVKEDLDEKVQGGVYDNRGSVGARGGRADILGGIFGITSASGFVARYAEARKYFDFDFEYQGLSVE